MCGLCGKGCRRMSGPLVGKVGDPIFPDPPRAGQGWGGIISAPLICDSTCCLTCARHRGRQAVSRARLQLSGPGIPALASRQACEGLSVRRRAIGRIVS